MVMCNLTRTIQSFSLTAIISTSTICFAQAPRTGDGQSKGEPQQHDGGVLAGPKVDDAPPGKPEDMMGPAAREERRRAPDVPLQQWMSSVHSLDLTQEQRDRIQAIADEFETAQREYQESLTESDREMVQKVREARQAGTPPPAEYRDKMQKLEAGRPKPGPYQERIWNELTDEQQSQVKTKLEEIRQRMIERRRANGAPRGDSMDDMYQGRRRDSNRAKPQAPQNPGESTHAQETDRANVPAGVDEMGQRRLNFLLARQSKSAQRPGRDASPDERRFKFDEDEPTRPDPSRPTSNRPPPR